MAHTTTWAEKMLITRLRRIIQLVELGAPRLIMLAEQKWVNKLLDKHAVVLKARQIDFIESHIHARPHPALKKYVAKLKKT